MLVAYNWTGCSSCVIINVVKAYNVNINPSTPSYVLGTDPLNLDLLPSYGSAPFQYTLFQSDLYVQNISNMWYNFVCELQTNEVNEQGSQGSNSR